jgi:HK97 family phage portal protein
MLLEEGTDFERLTFNSVDLQMLELRRFQVAEIARALRIPLHLLGDWERATWSNAETAGRQFLSFTLLPWLELWQQAIARSLLGPGERATYYAEFLTDDLVRADISARFEAYAKAVSNGILSANEVRSMENRPPLPGGDDLRVPMNSEPATQSDEEVVA